MTVEEITRRVAEIRADVRDDERAHIAEDGLWRDVLRAIAAGAENPAQLAAAALTSLELDFGRYCA